MYCPNGSGKTNFSLALFDIEYPLSYKWKNLDYYNNFIYAGYNTGNVSFEYSFKFGEDMVDYIYGKNAAGALIE